MGTKHTHGAHIYIKIVAKLWNQPISIAEEWLKKIRFIETRGIFSDMKRNKIISFAVKWMQLEIFVLSKLSPPKANIMYFSYSYFLDFI